MAIRKRKNFLSTTPLRLARKSLIFALKDSEKGSDSIERSVRENPKSEEPRFSRKPGESIFDYASRVSEDVDRSVRERVSARDEYEKKVKSKGFQTKETLQNSMLGLQEFMSAIDHASGNKRYIEDIPALRIRYSERTVCRR